MITFGCIIALLIGSGLLVVRGIVGLVRLRAEMRRTPDLNWQDPMLICVGSIVFGGLGLLVGIGLPLALVLVRQAK